MLIPNVAGRLVLARALVAAGTPLKDLPGMVPDIDAALTALGAGGWVTELPADRSSPPASRPETQPAGARPSS
jgi:hypothetical protein